MAAYLTVTRFKLLTTIPAAFIDAVELVESGYTDAQLEYWSRWIDAQLAKRYDVPFASPISNAVEGWLARIVTPRVWTKRGVDPEDAQWREVVADRDAAFAEIKEAANSETGLYDLPLRANTTDSGISRGFPRGYSEQSPYVWTTQQALRGTQEDSSGGGTDT
jgi:hypothetical protein